MAIYLGLDASTQSLSALVIDSQRAAVLVDESVNFEKDLPQYGCRHGVLPSTAPGVAHSDPLMWAEALDELLARVARGGFDWSRVEGISGAGQQHGSVYLREALSLRSGGSDRLRDQLAPLLSMPTAPMWMDHSTGAQCRAIAQALGGERVVLERTGSIPIERFTGPQIRKIFESEPQRYAETQQIHLVSSFMASLLVGHPAPIDRGDGAGMNLMGLASGQFEDDLLEATAPELRRRLLGPVASATAVGTVHPYFEGRYGLRADTPVIAFTGDNPSSLVGMGATAPGSRLISLGTSDTVFGASQEPHTDPRGYGHVFGNPMGGFMTLSCFTNGSLAREAVAQRCNLDWEGFAAAIGASPPGNGGRFMLPFYSAETTPRVHAPGAELFGDEAFRSYRSPAACARAVVEAQALLMRMHCDWMGQPGKVLRLAGGASRNRGIQRVLADVFQLPVERLLVTNASALGAALRAATALGGEGLESLSKRFVRADEEPRTEPHEEAHEAYRELAEQLGEALQRRLRGSPAAGMQGAGTNAR